MIILHVLVVWRAVNLVFLVLQCVVVFLSPLPHPLPPPVSKDTLLTTPCRPAIGILVKNVLTLCYN